MKPKKLMMHFFVERTYKPQSLQEFEHEAQLAAQSGATHMYIMDVPKRFEEWAAHPGDPYPNWGMLQTSLFKLVVPKALQPYMDVEYAKSNLELIRQRSEIVKKYGMQAAVLVIDPFYLPEAAYLDHPEWRGARCDHPRRSKDAYFSPCIDNEEVRQLYYEAMQELCKMVDIGFFQIITNDSGAGVCWSTGLYNGPNGPDACKQTSMANRILGFLQVLTDAARSQGRDMMIDITSDIFGYKAPEASMDAAWNTLGEKQMVSGRDNTGSRPVYHMATDLCEHVRPLNSLPFTVDFIKSLHKGYRQNSEYLKVYMKTTEFDEYIRIVQKYKEMQPENILGLMQVLQNVALDIVGEQHAGALLEAWCVLDEATRILADLHFDNFIWMPMMPQRLINRPLVPRPDLLTDEETSYYRPFLFQATTEEQARDLMNIQGMDFAKGFAAARMVMLSVKKAIPLLQNVIELLGGIATGNAETDAKLQLTARRVQALIYMAVTMKNAALYQEILDSTQPEEQPELNVKWPIEGDERLFKINEITRSEIDNTYALQKLLKQDGVAAYFTVAEEADKEDIFLVTEELPNQLEKKVRIMLAHLRDAEKIYESKNK